MRGGRRGLVADGAGIILVLLVGAGVKARGGDIGRLAGDGGVRRRGVAAAFDVLFGDAALDHDRFGGDRAGDDRAVVAVRLGHAGLGELGGGDGGDGGGVRGHGGAVAAVDADDGGATAHGLLGGHGADDGVVAVDGRGDAAAQTGGDAAVLAGGVGPRRVAQVTGHEEMLVGGGAGQRGHGGNERAGGFGRGAVGDARDVGDLDDVGGASEDGGSDGLSGLPRLGVSFLARCARLGILLAPLADDEPPDQEGDDGDAGEAADDPTGDGAGITATPSSTTAAVITGRATGARAAAGGGGDTFCGGAGVAGLADHGTGGALLTFGTLGGGGLAFDATFEHGAGGEDWMD